MKNVFLFLAEGAEPIEAVAPADILRRSGVETKIVATGDSLYVRCSKGLTIKADIRISEALELPLPDMAVLPGGMPGFKNLADDEVLGDFLRRCHAEGKFIAAICGAPSVLAKYSIAEGCRITCHTSVKDAMGAYRYTGAAVERDGTIITGKGAGRSVEFALELAEALTDSRTVAEVRKGMEC